MKKLTSVIAVAALSGAVLAGCATVPADGPAGRPVAFEAEDFAWSTRTGRNAISGKVEYRAQGGGAYACPAGASVGLTPDTPFSRQRIQRLYGSTVYAALPLETVRGRQGVEAATGDYSRFVRAVQCDAQGRFRFENLPDGAWFVIARARPVNGRGQEMAIMRRVETRGGRSQTVPL